MTAVAETDHVRVPSGDPVALVVSIAERLHGQPGSMAADTDLVELGMTSLAMVRLLAEASAALATHIRPADIAEAPTPRGIAACATGAHASTGEVP